MCGSQKPAHKKLPHIEIKEVASAHFTQSNWEVP